MNFISEKYIEIPVKFPKNCVDYFEKYDIVLRNKRSNVNFAFQNYIDVSGLADYYVFSISFNAVPDGEYEYEILGDGDKSVGAKGLIQIGERIISVDAYEAEETHIEYIS